MREARADDGANRALWVMVGAMLLYRIGYVLAHDFSLFVDEAQYWLWSTRPDWGYYSKPPLVAWLIHAATRVLGDTELAVKLPALLAYPVAAVCLYRVGRAMRDARTGLIAAALFLSMPGQALGGWVMSPDSILLASWSLALWMLWKAVHAPQQTRWWLGLGMAIGLGALAKYTMLVFVPMAAWVLWRHHRDAAHTRGPWIALGLALLLLSPNLFWNVQHEFETVKHTAELSNKSGAGLHLDKFAGFIGAQWGIFGLVAFPLLVWRLFKASGPAERFLKPFTVPYLAFMIALSLVTSANANWAVTAYAAGSVLLALWLAEGPRRGWIIVALLANLVLQLGLMQYRDVAKALARPVPNEGRDVFSRVLGWRELGEAVQRRMLATGGALPVLSNDRTLLAQFAFYLQPRPYRVDALDSDGKTSNQFEMTTRQRGLPDEAWFIVFNAGQNGNERPVGGAEIAAFKPLRDAGYVVVEDLGVVRVRRMDAPPRSVHMLHVRRSGHTAP